MLRQLQTYDWAEVFGFAGEPDTNNTHNDLDIGAVDEMTDIRPFTREDVDNIYGIMEGENEGEPWRIYGTLLDGRYFYLEAGTGYTGWDVGGGGHTRVASTRDCIERFGLTAEARRVFGLAEDNVGTIPLREPRTRLNDIANGFTNIVRDKRMPAKTKNVVKTKEKPVEVKKPSCSIMSLEIDDED